MFDELIIILGMSFLACICTTFVSFDFMRKLKRNVYRDKWVYGVMAAIHVFLVTSVSIFNYPRILSISSLRAVTMSMGIWIFLRS